MVPERSGVQVRSGEPDLQAHSQQATHSLRDGPVWHFVESELSMLLATLVLYCFFRLAAYASEYIAKLFPISDEQPLLVISWVFNWFGAISMITAFVFVTAFQIAVLLRRLKIQLRNPEHE